VDRALVVSRAVAGMVAETRGTAVANSG